MRSRACLLTTGLSLAVLWVGCEPPPPSPPPPAAPPVDALSGHMQEHFTQVGEARDALIAGDLEAAKKPATWILEHAAAKQIPEQWQTHVDAMRQAAEAASTSETVEDACLTIADMAYGCGECHSAMSVTVSLETPPEPAEGEDTAVHMLHHAWAAERMWEGLVAPSEELWLKGAQAFGGQALESDELTPGDKAPKTVVTLSKKVHELAAKATNVKDRKEQVVLYAELLGSCYTCHEELRSAPPAGDEAASAE